MDQYWVGNQIAMLRKKKGYTGDKFSEIIGVTPQAVSKWENGKCLPETSLLPKIAEILEVTIDQLLIEKNITIINAVFTDGINSTDVTKILDQFVSGNRLNIYLSRDKLGIRDKSERLGVVLVEYKLSSGVYYTYALENTFLTINKESEGIQYSGSGELEVVNAYFGIRNDYKECLSKIEHCKFFQWKELYVNTEIFPSSPSADDLEYLTLIYVNNSGMHVISAAENEVVVYSKGNTELKIKDISSSMLENINVLKFENGMDCTWGGAMTTALNHMGENYSYEQIMGISGACYRLSFCDIWDWSATDALVSYDYSSVLFNSLGYEAVWASRLNKSEREKERERIVDDILNNKPVLAINLRIAPEWGVITGYKEDGKRLYCRTYFDEEYLNDKEDYLESDFWPFLIQHFGEKKEGLSDIERLRSSLETMVNSFNAPCERGYYQGREGYEHWILGLSNDELWNSSKEEEVERRLQVNDALLLNLIDARRCAGTYLKECASMLQDEEKEILSDIADSYTIISEKVRMFREKINKGQGKTLCYNCTIKIKKNINLRNEEIFLLKEISEEERQLVEKAKFILDRMRENLI